jgi:hypothetical protein
MGEHLTFLRFELNAQLWTGHDPLSFSSSGLLAAPSRRYEAVSFMRNAIARIEAELTGRDVKESAS